MFATRRTDLARPEGYKASLPSLLLSSFTINILSLALPVMTLQVYDRILPNPGSGTLAVLMAGVCVALLLEIALRLCRAYVLGRSGAAYEHRMSCRAMERMLGADLTRIGAHGVGEHMHRFAAIGKMKDFYNGYALTVLIEAAFVPLFLILIVYIAHELAIVPAAIMAVFIAVSLWRGHRLQAALAARETADNTRFDFLIEALEGVHTVKSFALEKIFERRYEALEETSTARNHAVTQETAATFNTGTIFSHLMVAAVIGAGAYMALDERLTTGALIATLLLSGRMMQPVQKLLGLWARYQDYTLARARVAEMMTTPQRVLHTDAAPPRVAQGQLTLQDVTLHHTDAPAPVLSGIDLSLRRGEAIQLCGPHGTGKTSLLKVICGIYPATQGRVQIDGADIAGFAPRDLPRHVGYIQTNATIFRGTIRDNITCFGQTPEAQAREVAALLDLDKDVARLPGGFDTFLGGGNDGGITSGMKQRIAIVRTLATKPRLILFDNADRALDRHGYAMIYSLLARLKGKATLILVTDDHNIAGLADRRFDLASGTLRERDPETDKSNIHPYRELPLYEAVAPHHAGVRP